MLRGEFRKTHGSPYVSTRAPSPLADFAVHADEVSLLGSLPAVRAYVITLACQ